MTMRMRGDVHWIDFTPPGGKAGDRVRESLATTDKRAARMRYDARVAEITKEWKQKVDRGRMWTEASAEWLTERGTGETPKRTIEEDRAKLKVLDVLWKDLALEDIGQPEIKEFVRLKRLGLVGAKTPKPGEAPKRAKNATVNKWLALISAILRAAERDWGWIKHAPGVKLLSTADRKIRFLTREEVAPVLAQLSETYQDLVAFSLATGIRQANVCQLTWEQCSIENAQVIFDSDAVKNGSMLALPLNADAVAIVKKYVDRHKTRVFVNFRGQTLQRPQRREWVAALARAGITSFRWHDLRHTWASWMRQGGTPDAMLMELGGWKDPKMVRKYAHFDQSSLREYAERSSMNK